MTQTTDNELDYEEEVDLEEEELVGDKKNLKKQKKICTKGGCKIDSGATTGSNPYGPKLNMEGSEVILNEIGFFLHFFPVGYIKEIMLPSMNKETLIFEEFLCFS